MILSSFNTACFGDHKGRQNQGQLTNYLGDVDIGDGFGVLWGKGSPGKEKSLCNHLQSEFVSLGMAVELKKRKISREAYHVMIDAGIFGPEDKIELLNGEIIDMSPIGSTHMSVVNRLTHLFSQALSGSAIISVQNPLNLGEFSEPEPDLTIFKYREDFYEDAIPTAADVLLLIEVSDTTLKKDREVKLPLYAAAGISYLWIVDLENRLIEEYTNPKEGIYQNRLICKKGDVLILDELDIEIMFDDILP